MSIEEHRVASKTDPCSGHRELGVPGECLHRHLGSGASETANPASDKQPMWLGSWYSTSLVWVGVQTRRLKIPAVLFFRVPPLIPT